ncbi:MAG TPA: sigma 54 modulation/S30EA ribosomal C-terminal domain-containing protein, partial [Thermodesulfovibrionia bacterium]|nr:sigma 54 modulation/S30EA ribosomal C-terminal domain-containing protein [Thermodesulfovibrionia bacterium]
QRKKAGKSSDEEVEVEKTPIIVTEKHHDKKPMSPEEAAMELEILGNAFLVFTNASTNDINVIYKKADGNYGLITAVK